MMLARRQDDRLLNRPCAFETPPYKRSTARGDAERDLFEVNLWPSAGERYERSHLFNELIMDLLHALLLVFRLVGCQNTDGLLDLSVLVGKNAFVEAL